MTPTSASNTALQQTFTRQEVLALTKTSAWRLGYLAQTGIVVPTPPDANSGQLAYTWEQVVEIRAINALRRNLSLQTIRKIVDFLRSSGFDAQLKDKHLVVLNDDAGDEVGWIMPDWSEMPQVMKVTGKNVGQFVMVAIPPLCHLIDDLWQTARISNVIELESFRQRVQPTD